ncbi:hypothetical protein BOX15_Mlig017147g1, partial [Macrostomum lignano]
TFAPAAAARPSRGMATDAESLHLARSGHSAQSRRSSAGPQPYQPQYFQQQQQTPQPPIKLMQLQQHRQPLLNPPAYPNQSVLPGPYHITISGGAGPYQPPVQPPEHCAETNTVLTSETAASASCHEADTGVKDADSGIGAASSCSCARASTVGLSAALGVAAFASPPLMLALPRSGAFAAWPLGECGVACEGQLLGLAFRLLALLVAAWCLFFRRARASLPRVLAFRAFLLCLLFAVIAVFWAFYALRIVRQRERDYDTVVQFAVALADALLFLHYLGVVLLEIRHLQCRFSVKVLRSPDGEARLYTLGETSVQRAAVHVLQRYCVDFSAFNPHLHSMLTMSGGGGSGARNTRRYKFYELDRASSAASGHSRGQSRAEGGPSSAAERFQFECDFERRLRKRRARLVSAADEAFAHIGRTAQHRSDQSAGAAISRQMEASEAAQAVFPTLLRPLQRYLRVTRQQPRYSMDAVLQHLAACIRHGLGPRAFIERYLGQGRVVEDPRSGTAGQAWTLASDSPASRSLEDGANFCLRRGAVSLLCTVRRVPFFGLGEELLEPAAGRRFVLDIGANAMV